MITNFADGYRTSEYGDIPCRMTRCGGVMVLRKNGVDGSRFYGCSNYPECRFTRPWDDVEDEITHTLVGETSDPDDPYLEHSW